MAVATVSITLLDKSKEKSTVQYYTAPLTAGNIASVENNADFGVAATLAARIASLSLMTPISSKISDEVAKAASVLPGNMFAQREIGLQVSYADNVTGENYHLTIPGPDWANLGLNNSDQVDETKAAWTQFKADFEAGAVSKDGNAVTVTGGRLVGRNR